MNPPSAECQELREGLKQWPEGTLPGGECARLRQHLEGCAHCQELLEEEPLTKELLRQCGQTRLSAAEKRRLREQVMRQVTRPDA